MKKIRLQCWCSYPIFVNEEVEVENTNPETIEVALRDICERLIDEARPIPAMMDDPIVEEIK